MISDRERKIVESACRLWPVDEQAKWIAAMAPGIGAPTWKPVTQAVVARVYSRYLMMAERRELVGISPDGVRVWIVELESQGCCPRTIAGYLYAIYKVSCVVSAERPEWLRKTCRRIDLAASRTRKKKLAHIVPAEQIVQFGLETILRAKRIGSKSWLATQLFRDGLLLVYGIHGPERRRALGSVNISDVDLDQCRTTYQSDAIKGGFTSVRIMPVLVARLVHEWLADWRPLHLRGGDHGKLWIAKGGRAAGAAALTAAMKSLTKNAPWGYPITPHRLRDAAATTIVEEGPEVARLASIILGHQSEATTREYTETAKKIAASRAARQLISDARENAGRTARDGGAGGTLALLPTCKARRRGRSSQRSSGCTGK